MSTNGSWERKARQLLFDRRGRDALRKFGIDVEIADGKPAEDKPVVAVLCPTYRNPEAMMRDALGAMVQCSRDNGITVYSGPPVQSSVVHWSRNWLLAEQIKSGKPWTHVLFIDDDIVAEPETLVKLLAHKKDIVAGLCTRRNDPPVPNIRFYDKSEGTTRQIWEWPENQLIEVDSVGTGLMLLSRHAVEQTAQVYFDCLWEKDFYQLTDENPRIKDLKAVRLEKFDADKTCYWFRFLPTPKGDIEAGEDIFFCYAAKTYCDMPVYVDTSVQPGHLGPYAYGIKDFVPYRDLCIERAKRSGNYKMEVPDMKISILCPTRNRPQNVINMIKSLQDTSTVMPEVVFYVDDDDSTFPEVDMPTVKVLRGPRILMTEMWNRCAEAASGEIMLLSGDDVLFKTKGWDDKVRRAFAVYPDRLVLVHGDDGLHGDRFATHCFLHRAWIDAVGYFSPPYFSSDFGDTWINDVFNALDRRIFLPIVTEHLHPLAGKGEWDKTHQERLERHTRDNPQELYQKLAPKRLEDIQKVRALLNIPWKAKESADGNAHQSIPDGTGQEIHAT